MMPWKHTCWHRRKHWEKLADAHVRLKEAQKQFAAKNNINLIQSESESDRENKIVNDVMDHSMKCILFFKCYKQEGYLVDAINKKNLVSIEQSLNSLRKFAEEGTDKLKKLTGYEGDNSLIAAGLKAMGIINLPPEEAGNYRLFSERRRIYKTQNNLTPNRLQKRNRIY